MKKVILTLVASTAVFTSCRDSETLLDKEGGHTLTEYQLQNEIAKFPEKAFTITQGLEAGNNKYLIQYNTVGSTSTVHDDFGYMSILFGTEHMTNDLVMAKAHWFNSYYNYTARNVNSIRTKTFWNFYYKVIYNMNDIINLIGDNPTNNEAKYLKARSLALRALSHYDLVKLYAVGTQGIPYRSKNVNSDSRLPVAQVLQLIETDLLQAYNDLAGYTRPNKQHVDQNVVAGILARFYMTKGEYASAALYANRARQGYMPMNSTELMDGFDEISNPEWMWGADIDGATTGIYASFFSHMGTYNAGYAGLLGVYRNIDKRLYEQISDTDLRKQWWLSAATGGKPKYANRKFIDSTNFLGDYLFMRAGEFYFIEAEALARSGNEAGAKQVLFDIMTTRNTAYVLSTNTGQALLDEININKRVELWGEGQNFYDMKRLGQNLERDYVGSNHIAIGKFNIPAGDKKFIFQIPQAELDTNTNLSNP